MRSLIAVADHGSLSAAADKIGLSQPALTRRIQQLEQHFGSVLLERSRKGIRLTQTGELVLQEARLLVARYEQLQQSVRAHQGLEQGTISMGGGATAVSFVLPAAIAAFQQSFPQIRFHLKEAGSTEVARDVVSGRLELGLVTLPLQQRELHVQPLFKDRIVLVAPKEHPLSQQSEVTPEQLQGQAMVGFEAGTAVRQLIDNRLHSVGVQANVVMELRSIPAILRMVEQTGLLAFVSHLAVEDAEAVQVLALPALELERELAMVWRQQGELSPAARAFVQELQGEALRDRRVNVGSNQAEE